MRVSQSWPMQDGTSGLSDVSQQMLISVLPPVLVLHLNRFRYDAAASGIMKIGKSIRFESDLQVPLGTNFRFSRGSRGREYFMIWSIQTLWYPMLNNPQSHHITSSMECSTITAILQAAGTIRSMSFTWTETATQGKIGCTSMMK